MHSAVGGEFPDMAKLILASMIGYCRRAHSSSMPTGHNRQAVGSGHRPGLKPTHATNARERTFASSLLQIQSTAAATSRKFGSGSSS